MAPPSATRKPDKDSKKRAELLEATLVTLATSTLFSDLMLPSEEPKDLDDDQKKKLEALKFFRERGDKITKEKGKEFVEEKQAAFMKILMGRVEEALKKEEK